MIDTDYTLHIHIKIFSTLLEHKQYIVTKDCSLVRDPLHWFVQRSRKDSNLYDYGKFAAIVTLNSGVLRLSLCVIAKCFIFIEHQGDVSFRMGGRKPSSPRCSCSLTFSSGTNRWQNPTPVEAYRFMFRTAGIMNVNLGYRVRYLSPFTELYLDYFEEKVLYIHSRFLLKSYFKKHAPKLSSHSDHENESKLTTLLPPETQSGVYDVIKANRSMYNLPRRGN
jgi:hypothetical protein